MKRRLLIPGAALAGGALLWRGLHGPEPVPLRDRVVILTGASSGIGRAAAHAFAAEGARLALAARRGEALLSLAEELEDYGSPALAVPTDVRRDEDLAALVRRTLAAFGRLDVLVNNAGLSYGGPLPEQPPAQIRALLETNLYGPLRLTQMVLPVMLGQGAGHIVNVSSMAGQIAPPGMAAYAATRRALTFFSDALRRELDGTGIHVSTVLPTWTRTPMVQRLAEQALRGAGALPAGERVDMPEVPATAIVDAVRYRRRTVALGGPWMRSGYLSERLAPWLVDLYFRLGVDVAAFMAVARGLGAPASGGRGGRAEQRPHAQTPSPG